jgi:hypothetical protein
VANNGKLKLTDYDLTDRSNEEIEKVKKSIAKRQRRWDREHIKAQEKKKEKSE